MGDVTIKENNTKYVVKNLKAYGRPCQCCNSKVELYDLLELIISTHGDYFYGILNDMQIEATQGLSEAEQEKSVFYKKQNIPLYFLNMMLTKYSLHVNVV